MQALSSKVYQNLLECRTFALVLITNFAILFGAVPESQSQWVQTDPAGIMSQMTVSSFAVSGTNIFAGTHDSGVFISSNNGTSWTQVNNGLPQLYVNALGVTGSSMLVGMFNYGVFRSVDNGANWVSVNDDLFGANNIETFLTVGSNLYVGTFGAGVFLSTNDGVNWTKRNTGMENFPVLSLLSNGSYLFAGTLHGGIFRSSTNGASWVAVNTGLPDTSNYAYSGLAVFGGNIFAGTSNFSGPAGIYRSSDNGANWTSALGNLPVDTYFPSLAVVGSNLYSGTNKGLYCTSDNGTTWHLAQTGLTGNAIYVDAFAISGSSVFVGTEGVGVWKRPLSQLATLTSTASSMTSFSNYPNPFSDRTRIEFSSNVSGAVEVSIMNLLGQQVAQIFSGRLNAGGHSFEWNPAGIAPGMYSGVIRANGEMTRFPMMLVR